MEVFSPASTTRQFVRSHVNFELTEDFDLVDEFVCAYKQQAVRASLKFQAIEALVHKHPQVLCRGLSFLPPKLFQDLFNSAFTAGQSEVIYALLYDWPLSEFSLQKTHPICMDEFAFAALKDFTCKRLVPICKAITDSLKSNASRKCRVFDLSLNLDIFINESVLLALMTFIIDLTEIAQDIKTPTEIILNWLSPAMMDVFEIEQTHILPSLMIRSENSKMSISFSDFDFFFPVFSDANCIICCLREWECLKKTAVVSDNCSLHVHASHFPAHAAWIFQTFGQRATKLSVSNMEFVSCCFMDDNLGYSDTSPDSLLTDDGRDLEENGQSIYKTPTNAARRFFSTEDFAAFCPVDIHTLELSCLKSSSLLEKILSMCGDKLVNLCLSQSPANDVSLSSITDLCIFPQILTLSYRFDNLTDTTSFLEKFPNLRRLHLKYSDYPNEILSQDAFKGVCRHIDVVVSSCPLLETFYLSVNLEISPNFVAHWVEPFKLHKNINVFALSTMNMNAPDRESLMKFLKSCNLSFHVAFK